MSFVLVFLAALAAVVAGTTLYLARRERAHRQGAGGTEGLLIERQRTSQATRIRGIYSSFATHHGNGLLPDNLHQQYS
ncbi:hypothetical protein AB0O91_30755 [Kitasatospora sp. NPDC089797]|uniref:hypothetical protein n=1 Tax=Kitasatospora sp. NPDC089797 TaxID=3155298 RepID=UPI00342058EB